MNPKKPCFKCLACENITKRWDRKFCSSKCQQLYQRLEKFKQIESGDQSLRVRNYRQYLITRYGARCMNCGWDKINPITQKCPIELDHIDGNSDNNSLSNLKLICPNCHSLTPTFKNLNKGNGRQSRRQRYKDGKSW
jgi:hypothetical protein